MLPHAARALRHGVKRAEDASHGSVQSVDVGRVIRAWRIQAERRAMARAQHLALVWRQSPANHAARFRDQGVLRPAEGSTREGARLITCDRPAQSPSLPPSIAPQPDRVSQVHSSCSGRLTDCG